MTAARRAIIIAAIAATSLSPALAAPHHTASGRPYAHVPRITIYPARRYIDFSRYIDPLSGMYCENTGWAAVCVPPRRVGYYGVNCVPAWPFPVCTRF